MRFSSISPDLSPKRLACAHCIDANFILRALLGTTCTCHEWPGRLTALDAPRNQATSYPDRFPAEHTVSPCCHTSCPPSGPLRTNLSWPSRFSASSTGAARRSLPVRRRPRRAPISPRPLSASSPIRRGPARRATAARYVNAPVCWRCIVLDRARDSQRDSLRLPESTCWLRMRIYPQTRIDVMPSFRPARRIPDRRGRGALVAARAFQLTISLARAY